MTHIDLRNLDLNLLVALDRLIEHRSVTLAARDLGLSQPATSRALQRLRETLGDPLLVQVGRDMVPTERASALALPVTEALAALQRVFEPSAAFDPLTARGTFSVGLGDEVQQAFGDAIVRAIWERAPHIDLRLRPLSARSAVDGRRGELDLALAPDLSALPQTSPPVDVSDYVARHLYTRRWVVVRAAGPVEPLDLDAFCAAAHVIVAFDGSGRGFVDEILAEMGRSRRVAATAGSFHAALTLAAACDLVATMPEEIAATAGLPLRIDRPPLPIPDLPMHLLWHPRLTADPRHQFLRERVADGVRARLVRERLSSDAP